MIKPRIPLLERLTQRRTPLTATTSDLRRCLSVFDLVNSGFSSMVGAGIFVITPVLTANTTGPAVTLSYLVAGLATLISALTYAELAGRFQGIGSSYFYVYCVLGELAASIIGISTLIESMIGLASVVKSLSIYSDQLLFNGTIIAWEQRTLPLHMDYMTDYVDLYGLLILCICGALNMWGVKQTVVVSALCNVVVVVSLVVLVVVGFVKGSFSNWFDAVPPEGVAGGTGGYLPYGWSGVFTGASLAYFSYNGFDTCASLGCEARNPQKDIPTSIVISFSGVMGLYVLVCGAITYMAPYYTLGNEAGLALAFASVPWVKYTISAGAVLATATGSFASVLVTSRIMFSMAQDGILFKGLTYVSPGHIPLVSILVSMVLPALGILLLNIEELVMMNSGGLLICFCLTNICVVVGRYQPQYPNPRGTYSHSEQYSLLFCLLFWFCSLAANLCFLTGGFTLFGALSGGAFSVVAAITLLLIYCAFSEIEKGTTFRCPWVPLLPGLGIFINSSLMVSLPLMTWVRVGCCLLVGLLFYLSYGLLYSNITVEKQNLLRSVELDSSDREGSSPENFSESEKLIGHQY